MMKFYITFLSILILGISAFSQNTKEYNENEFYGGYSYQWNNSGSGSNGFEVAYTRNVSRFVGVKADFSAAFKNRDDFSNLGITVPTIKSKSSVYNVLGGVQVKDNKTTKRFKPFAHALVGVGHKRIKNEVFCPTKNCTVVGPNPFKDSATGIAGGFGGGIDIKINDKIDFRAIQVDYNPIYIKNRTDQNVRFSIGFVIK